MARMQVTEVLVPELPLYPFRNLVLSPDYALNFSLPDGAILHFSVLIMNQLGEADLVSASDLKPNFIHPNKPSECLLLAPPPTRVDVKHGRARWKTITGHRVHNHSVPSRTLESAVHGKPPPAIDHPDGTMFTENTNPFRHGNTHQWFRNQVCN